MKNKNQLGIQNFQKIKTHTACKSCFKIIAFAIIFFVSLRNSYATPIKRFLPILSQVAVNPLNLKISVHAKSCFQKFQPVFAPFRPCSSGSDQGKQLISFDYAIKYLLKHREDYDIIESFLNAVIQLETGPIKIESLAESASNKEAEENKSSIADLLVKDALGYKYVVEIERNSFPGYAEKSLFNVSRVLVDDLSAGQDFTKIKKIFHISLLYDNKNVEDCVHHGKMLFQKRDTTSGCEIEIEKKNNNYQGLFPEYFYIFVNGYRKEKAENELEEWLYFLKSEKIGDDSKLEHKEKMLQKLDILRMSKLEKNRYIQYMKRVITDREVKEAAEKKGEAKVIREQIAEREAEIKNLREKITSKELPEKIGNELIENIQAKMQELEARLANLSVQEEIAEYPKLDSN